MKTMNRLFNIIIILFMCLVILLPLYWTLVTSIKPTDEIFTFPPSLFPESISLENYWNVFQRTSVVTYFTNSIVITGGSVAFILIIASLAAYSITRYPFKGKVTYFLVILLAQIMPLTTLIVPLYIMWGKLGMLNSYSSIILTYSAILLPTAIWLLTGYFKGVPKDIDEAATIDGCSSFGILVRMVIPLARSGLVAVGLTVCITVWQELMISMTFVSKDTMRTLPAGISSFITKSGIQWGSLTAAGILTAIPVIIIFVVFQKALVRGLTSGAMKG